MIWNEENKKQIYNLINIDLDDPTLKQSLITFRYQSIPQGVRDIAYRVVEGQDISDIEKNMKKKGLYALYPDCSNNELTNPDFFALSEYLTTDEISMIYSASLAISISTKVFSKETLEKYPNLAEDLTEPKNATEFLGIVNSKILDELGCSDLIHKIFYGDTKRPNIPILDPKNLEGIKNDRVDANKVLNNTYSDIMKKLKNSSKDKFSSEAMTTLFCYGVLKEIEKIENSANFKHYNEKQVDKSGLTWKDVLNQLKDYIQTTYMPVNAFKMPKELASIQSSMKKYREDLTERAKKEHHPISQTANFKEPACYKNVETVHIHHIFKHSDFEELANQKSNFIAIDPSTHYTCAHPDNDTKKVDPEFQQYALLIKFLDKDTLLYSREGWKELGLFNVIDKALGSNFCEKYGKKGVKPSYISFVNELAEYNPNFKLALENECVLKELLAQSYNKNFIRQNSYSDLVKDFCKIPNINIKSDFFMDIAKTYMFEEDGTTQKLINFLIEDLEDNGLSKNAIINALIETSKTKIKESVSLDDTSLRSCEMSTNFIINEALASISLIQNQESLSSLSTPELKEAKNILKQETVNSYSRKVVEKLIKEQHSDLKNMDYNTILASIAIAPSDYITPELISSLAFIPEDKLDYGDFNHLNLLYNDISSIRNITKNQFVNTIVENIHSEKDYVLACSTKELIKRELDIDVDFPVFKNTQPIYDKYNEEVKELYPSKSLKHILKQDPEFLPPTLNEIINNYNNELINTPSNLTLDVNSVLEEQRDRVFDIFSPLILSSNSLSETQYKEYQSEYIKEQLQDLFNYTPTKEMANDIFDLITRDTNFDDGFDKFVQVVSCYGVNSINDVIQDYDYILDNIQIEI